MNINDLTLGQAKELAGLFDGKADANSNGLNCMVGKKAIIRTYSAGVWFGTVAEKAGDEIILKDAIRMNYFKTVSGISLSSIANNGVHRESRLAEPVESIWLQPIEIIPCTEKSIKSIEAHPHE
jgi:hypothetical protein